MKMKTLALKREGEKRVMMTGTVGVMLDSLRLNPETNRWLLRLSVVVVQKQPNDNLNRYRNNSLSAQYGSWRRNRKIEEERVKKKRVKWWISMS
ncbi:hypothetical protein L6452_03741 [Arctium lappa]|uniref:Uncharacterized protein n=1 Tax=Arctium lappa TaxID=4217 RepID=A0ACB9FMG6_ARCLA|nr:hypothetical protein L6452_03741 [Arctium lappa]